MRLIEMAVSRWQATTLVALLLIILGVQAYLTIPRSVDPHFPTPLVFTTVLLPGGDAQQMEESVAKPIERALQGIEHIREIRSESSDGATRVVAEFEHGTDAELALDRVTREVNAIQGRLPDGISSITFFRPRTSEAAVLQLAMISEGANWRRMAGYASDLRDRLSTVPGVRSVTIDGIAEPEVRIAVDPERLAALGLSEGALAARVQEAGLQLPGGAVTSGTRRFNLDTGGAFRSLEAIRAIVLRTDDGRAVSVGDVATVSWAEAERLHITRFNGRRAVFLTVRQKDGSDVKSLQRAANAEVERFRADLPPDMAVQTGFDQSRDIDAKLNTLQRDFLLALALVLLTLAPLGLRASLIVMVSIPISLASGIIVLWALGHSFNQISLSGFIVSLGLLVDDSIVVIENVERRLREGADRITAAVAGAREIAPAVLGATAVLLMAFLPLAMLPEAAGDFVRGLPLAVIATVASSLVVSLTIIPFLSSRFARVDGSHSNRLLVWLTDTIHRTYAPVLRATLARPRRWVLSSVLLCVAGLGIVPVIGFSLFPAAETPYFLVRVQTPNGSSLASTDRVVRRVSDSLAREPLVADRMENAGARNPQVFYNVVPTFASVREGEVFVTLTEWDKKRVESLLARLRRQFENDPDANITIVTFDNGPPIEAPVAIRLRGPDVDELRRLSAQVADELRSVPGLRDVVDPAAWEIPGLALNIDPDKAALLGVPQDEVRRILRLAIGGQDVGTFIDDEGESWPVTVKLPYEGAAPIAVLDKIYVPSSSGASVPLLQVVDPVLTSEPAKISRRDFERTVTITGWTEPGVNVASATADALERVSRIKMPEGYRLSLGGNAEASKRNFAGIWSIALLAMFGILIVLVIEFGTLTEALVVAGVVPLGIVGGLVALLATGNSLSFLAAIGFIALAGIEVKNSILLVDFAGRQKAAGLSAREAIERAGELRFLPVLLTSLTAIGGLLPLAVGGSALYSPLAWVIIGGLISSTLLSRIITPATYLLLVKERQETALSGV
jgi:multidrug efflux pump subunit AcrB